MCLQYSSQEQAQLQAHYFYDQLLQRKARYEVVDFQNGFDRHALLFM